MHALHDDEAPAPGLYRCSAAGHQGERWLPPTEFWRKTSSPTKLQSRCRDCTRRANIESYYRHRRTRCDQNKRFRLRSGYQQPPATRERIKERKRDARLAQRQDRARLLLSLVAQEYGLEERALHGPSLGGRGHRASEAQAIAVRLIRYLTVLSPDDIAGIMDCTVRAVEQRLRRARNWTRPDRGDIRIRERVRRIMVAYRQHVPPRSVERQRR